MKTKNTNHVRGARALALSIALLGSVGTAGATVVDLTNPPLGTQGTLGGVIFKSGSLDTSTGSGVYDPFVRIQQKPVEEGFNTGNDDVMPDVKEGAFTKEVQLSSLRTINLGGTDYVQLSLDLGEPASDESKISLVDFRVFVRDTIISDADDTFELFSGAPLFAFDLSDNDRVDLDYTLVSSGNGRSDMFVYLPASSFTTNYEADDYFYLYSKLGTTSTSAPPYPSDGTFEEWGLVTTGSPLEFPDDPPAIPEPATMLFGGALVGVIGFARRRRSQ